MCQSATRLWYLFSKQIILKWKEGIFISFQHVLDKCCARFVNHMGSDLTIVNAAKVLWERGATNKPLVNKQVVCLFSMMNKDFFIFFFILI
jgi:hypothetical protein